AQHHGADHRRGNDPARLCDLRCRHAGLPRPRGAGSLARLGPAGGERAGLRADRLVDGDLPGRGAGDAGGGRQPGGRWHAAGEGGAPAAAHAAAARSEALAVRPRRRRTLLRVLNDVSFTIGRGEACGLVGESGCGKTTVAMSLMRYLPDNAVVDSGRIMFDDEDVLTASDSTLRKWRGDRMAMVYQDPGTALNPAL